jgi:hypothetical protein
LPNGEICDRIEKNLKRRREMQNQFDESAKQNTDNSTDGEYAYKSVIKKDMKNRRTISVISLALAVLSILLFRLPILALILGVLSIGGAAFSRKNLGYFDKISLAAIIIGIFGVVFALSGIIFANIFDMIFG